MSAGAGWARVSENGQRLAHRPSSLFSSTAKFITQPVRMVGLIRFSVSQIIGAGGSWARRHRGGSIDRARQPRGVASLNAKRGCLKVVDTARRADARPQRGQLLT